jgi:hypothetical protein
MNRYKVQLVDLMLDDKMIGYEEETEQSIFTVSPEGALPFYKDPKMISRIHIEMNLNKRTVVRQVYTFLDWLGDWGGLRDALMLIGSMLLPIFQWETLENKLLRLLYKQQNDVTKEDRGHIPHQADTVEKIKFSRDTIKSRKKLATHQMPFLLKLLPCCRKQNKD